MEAGRPGKRPTTASRGGGGRGLDQEGAVGELKGASLGRENGQDLLMEGLKTMQGNLGKPEG